MRSVWNVVLAALTALTLAGRADAIAYYHTGDGRHVPLAYWAGEGDNESVVIVDFREGVDDYVVAFGYRWEAAESPRTLEALREIDAAGDLAVDIVELAWGAYVDSISYLGHTTQLGDGLPLLFVDGIEAGSTPWGGWDADPADEGLGWLLSPIGINDRYLVDHAFDGWLTYREGDFDLEWNYLGPYPRVPTDTEYIPEPGCAALLAAGLCGLAARRRRRKRA